MFCLRTVIWFWHHLHLNILKNMYDLGILFIVLVLLTRFMQEEQDAYSWIEFVNYQ